MNVFGNPDWAQLWVGRSLLMQGLVATLLLTASVWILGCMGGLLLALARYQKQIPLLQWLGSAWIESLRSLPLMLFLVFIHYGVMPLFSQRPDFWYSSMIAFALFESVYLAEIFRGGLNAVSSVERDAAQSLGLSAWLQHQHVILPLALSRMRPALVNQAVTLLKDSSLASIVGVLEFTRAGEILYEQTYHEAEVLVFQALIYGLLCFGLIRVMGKRRFI